MNERKSTYRGGIAWLGLLLGVGIGLSFGLFYTWEVDPIIEKNTAPWQLGPQAQEDYVVAVALSYAYNGNLTLAFDRLRALRPDQDVWSMVAEIACERHKTVQVKTNSDVVVMRALEQLYRPQRASGCADGQYPTPAPISFVTAVPTPSPTVTLPPPASKTPTLPLPTSTSIQTVTPTRTPPPSGRYIVANVAPFCNAARSGRIEVRVYNSSGLGVPGMPVEVTWGGDQRETFYTGLKPAEGPEFADFEMEPGLTYSVTIPGLVSSPDPVEAVPCDGDIITSYQINFQQQPN